MSFKSRRRRGSLPQGINSRQLTLPPSPSTPDSTFIDSTTMLKAYIVNVGPLKGAKRSKTGASQGSFWGGSIKSAD